MAHSLVWSIPLLQGSVGTLGLGIYVCGSLSLQVSSCLSAGSSTCPVSLLLTLSTLYLLDEDPAGSQAESPLPVVSGEASEQAPPPAMQVREQQPLSSLSSVQLYRTSPLDLRLIFYDEVGVCVWGYRVEVHLGRMGISLDGAAGGAGIQWGQSLDVRTGFG